MNKLSAIIKREYLQRVRNKWFILATLIAPLMLAALVALPALVGSMQNGGKTRFAIIDQTDKLFDSLRVTIGRSDDDDEEEATEPQQSDNRGPATNTKSDAARYEIERVQINHRSLDEVRRELNQRVQKNQLDGYLIIPDDILTTGQAEYFGRKGSDIFLAGRLKDKLSEAVREQRLRDNQINQARVRELSRPVALNRTIVSERGEEKDSGESFVLSYVVGGLIYVTILLYGGMIMSAVVEEKTTRVAEMLFSSVRPFTLMLGKLLGVSLVALTQCAIWGVAFALVTIYGMTSVAAAMAGGRTSFTLPSIAPSAIIYFVLFFLLGYFVYATLYALIGSLVNTVQEGQQLSLPLVFILVFAFSLIVPVLRNPNSTFSFWISLVPFFSPITMIVRIFSQTPPFWQIALSLLIGFGTVVFLIWVAARIYRTGMLMYGKRASLAEMWRWMHQP
jgi:ABC-2 type transport system permease protein